MARMNYKHYAQYGWTKEADLYHLAPTTERERIQQHGLQPANPNINEKWMIPGPHEEMESVLKGQPTGVYLQGDPEKVHNWGTGHPDPNYDVWKIPEDQALSRMPDPLINKNLNAGGAWVVNQPIQPELYRGGPETYEEPPELGPSPHDWVNYHDWHELGNPSDEDFKNWGIGKLTGWNFKTADKRTSHIYDFYHYAPTEDRARILQHGLQASDPGIRNPWLEEGGQLGAWGPEHWSFVKEADKLHGFLMNPKSRPDLQTPEAQGFLNHLQTHYHNDKTDALMPWMTREWKKGRMHFDPQELRDYPQGTYAPFEIPPNLHYHSDPYNLLNGEEPPPTNLSPETLNHWGDFMRSNHPIQRGLGDIMQHNLQSFQDHVGQWDQAMKDKQNKEALAGGQVVHTTPDGYTIRQLHTPEELKAEGDAMGHCVGGYANAVANGDSMIYSLRDPQGLPHATTEIEPTHYNSPYEGITNEQYGGDQGMEQNEPIPHRGNVVQIQGKGNEEPNPEYKKQLAHWFGSFSDEDRPQRDHAQWNDHDEDEMWDPNDIEPHHLNPSPIDEYGLKKPPLQINWPCMIEGTLGSQKYDNGSYDAGQGKLLHQLALAHGQIPEFVKAVNDFTDDAQNSFNDFQENNFDWMPPYPDEDDPNYEQAMNNFMEAEGEMAKQHPPTQAAHHLNELLAPHWNGNLDQGPVGTFS